MNGLLYHSLILAIGLLLLAAGIVDFRKQQISRRFIFVLLIICFAAMFLKTDFSIYDAIGGFAIGACTVGISMISHEQIGRGDGFVIAAIGIALGFRRCLLIVCVAVFIMCIAAIVVLALRKGNKQTRLPFLPALFAGYILYFIQ